jgi:fermentation-respiration switch protein FrsA (DUF1100 family)
VGVVQHPGSPPSPAPHYRAPLLLQMFSWLGYLKPLVLRIYWPSNERIVRVTAPILFICGTKDELIPPSHTKDLYELAKAAKGALGPRPPLLFPNAALPPSEGL